MKNIFYSFLIIMVMMTGYSCLDETIVTDLNYDRVFSDSLATEGFLLEVYRDIGFDVRGNRFSKDNETFGGLQTACDEAEYRTSPKVTADVQFAMGTVNPIVMTDDAWKTSYTNIRRVNQFFKGLEIAPIEDGKKKTLRAEARFLRAWYYHILLRHYGGVPLIGDTIYKETDKMKDTRDTFEDCVDYIIAECEAAAPDLVVAQQRPTYGRVLRPACQALIARIKLYAASPLYNGGLAENVGSPANKFIGYTNISDGDKKQRWQEAMDAANEFMTDYGSYNIDASKFTLYERHTNPKELVNGMPVAEPGNGFYGVFNASDASYRPDAYREIILDERSLGIRAKESWFQPPSRTGSTKSGFPYQELVDAFPMLDGSDFDWENPEHAANPFANRDPRLRNTVLYDGLMLAYQNAGSEEVKIYLNEDGSPNGKDAVHFGTPTGYYVNKMVSRTIAANSVHDAPEEVPLMRVAEILLNYIEALNECNMGNGGGVVPADDKTYTYLKWIRRRAGINSGNGDYNDTNEMYGLKKNMTRLEMREAIQHERRLELAFEGHRFFDVRRWCIANKTDSQEMHGMEIRRLENGTKIYTIFPVRQRIFRDATYFWPIPYSETTKLPNMVQNPGYNL